MSKSKTYNWWDDPNNQEEVKRISWWNHPENKEDYMLPISVIESDGVWVAAFNDETKLVLGDRLSGCSQGETKAAAIEGLFKIVRITHDYSEQLVLRYQRWVPFRKGNWKHIGGTWFVVFGLHIYFRYGKNMKGGWYVPFTKLNISIHNEWIIYKNHKRNQNL
jgi:hypothetical protein